MKYEVKLSIKAMVRYEMMTGQSFQEIDYTNAEDIANMLYCAVLCSNNVDFTKEEFLALAENERVLTDMTKRLMKSSSVIQQFTAKINAKPNDDHKSDPVFVKDIVSTLIVSAGLDAEYVMERMDFSDISLYINAYERRKQEEMESSRLWTFYVMSTACKIRKPSDVIVFPWESEKLKQEAEKALQRDRESFEKFMRGELVDLDKIKWNKKEN